jgi:phosphopentomutase
MASTSRPPFPRVILLVLDGAGCGELPDAAAYGDAGSNTLGHVAEREALRIPHLERLGLQAVLNPGANTDVAVEGARGRMAEVSPGKDSVTGHWEMMGLRLTAPFATFPDGFPATLIEEFERRIGRRTLGNTVASGTAIIEDLGAEHIATGRPIVYTSADSVLQIAAHEDVVPVEELYRLCRVAFELVAPLRVARVIARPFVGPPGSFTRTANRHDFAVSAPGPTLLDLLTAAGVLVVAIGKINDLFAGRGIGCALPTASDTEGMTRVIETMAGVEHGLIVANLVDFDTVYGHRNDVAGYARNLERFDERLGDLLPRLGAGDLLMITADHGNDPTTPSTDHSREYVPLLLAGAGVRRNVDLGTRATFADLGQTLARNFGVGPLPTGVSFLEEIVVDHS